MILHLILGFIVRFAPQLPQLKSLTFVGDPHGLYRLSSYTEPSIKPLHLSAFMFACLADLFDAIANQNFWAHQAYPDGRYECRKTYPFLHGPVTFALKLVRVDAPNWDFTFSDIADDLWAIFNAVQYFDDSTYGIPQMIIEVFRYRNGKGGSTFLASQGGFAFASASTANVSVS